MRCHVSRCIALQSNEMQCNATEVGESVCLDDIEEGVLDG